MVRGWKHRRGDEEVWDTQGKYELTGNTAKEDVEGD
jgi:hypothetical protein